MWRKMISGIALLVLVALTTTPPRLLGAQAPPEKAVEPAAGVPGSTFRFFATGYGFQARVVFWATDPNGVIYGDPANLVNANNDGRADWEWVAPIEATFGTWTMVAQELRDEDELIEDRVQMIEFAIIPIEEAGGVQPPADIDAPDSATRNVQPVVGTPGAEFSFFADGFERRERVGFWFNAPDGTIYSDDRQFVTRASEDGRADWSWATPIDAPIGIWQAVALGRDSGIQRVIFFEIVPITAVPPGEDGGSADRGVSPAVAQPSETVAFFADGFAAREKVSFWAIDPNERIYGENGNKVNANAAGRADWFWRVASDAVPGEWQMVAFGNRTEVTKIIRFQVVLTDD